MFLKILMTVFFNLVQFLQVELKTLFELHHQALFGLKMYVYVSKFEGVVCLLTLALYLKLNLL